MRRVRAMLARLWGMFAGRRADEDLRAELANHLELATAENLSRGMTPAEARRSALLSSGGVDQAVDAVRDQRGLPWLAAVAADLKHAGRTLRLSPGFTATVVLTLALGIGANTAIFSVVRGVMLRPLPHADGDRLLYLRQSTDATAGANLAFSVPEVRDLREGVPSIGGMAEYSTWTMVHQDADGTVRINAALVTGNWFEVMGLAPVHGRVTGPRDDGPAAARVAVLTHEYWQSRFGGDPTVVGRQLILDREPVTVIGVLQPAPFYPVPVDAVLNMVNSEHHLSAMMVEGRTHRMTEVVARLAPDATLAQARTELESVFARMKKDHPEAYDAASHARIAAVPLAEVMAERARLTLLLLMGVAGFVLVIAVASVANLTLMRGVRRQHELVVRAALGAGVLRLRRLLLVENLVLAFLGAAVGMLIATTGLRLLVTFVGRYSLRAAEVRLDAPVFAFMAVLTLAVGLLLTLLVALPREGTLTARIAEAGHRIAGSVARYRLQRGLVVLQVAVSVVLLAGAGLLTRTMLRLADVDTGLTSEQVLSMSVPLLTPTELLTNPAADVVAKQRYEEMRARIAALPGVVEAGIGSPGPLRRSTVRFDVKVESRPALHGEAMPNAELRTAGPEFFRAAGIPLVRGRAFESTDSRAAPLVVIINETLADRLFPDEDPIGRRIAWTGDVLRFAPIGGDWRTVVGVARNTQDGGLDAAPGAVVFMPFAQVLAIGGTLVVRTEGDPADIVASATRIVREIAPQAPIERVQTIAQVRDESVAPRRLNAALIASFSLLAVLIAAVGIGGVLAFSVSARTNEIGIRMSLGADRGRVARMVLREGGTLLAAGIVLGIVGAALTTRLIRGLLFGIAPYDPVTFVAVAILMVTTGLLASLVPALRAARIDPVITVRSG